MIVNCLILIWSMGISHSICHPQSQWWPHSKLALFSRHQHLSSQVHSRHPSPLLTAKKQASRTCHYVISTNSEDLNKDRRQRSHHGPLLVRGGVPLQPLVLIAKMLAVGRQCLLDTQYKFDMAEMKIMQNIENTRDRR